jgi:hypothetical protein
MNRSFAKNSADSDFPLEDLEIDGHTLFSILDPSRPLLIDTASRTTARNLIIFSLFHLILLTGLSISVPKDHSIDRALFRVNSTLSLNYLFTFAGSSESLRGVTLSLRAFRESSEGRSIVPAHFNGAALRFSPYFSPTLEFCGPAEVNFSFRAGRHQSPAVKVWKIPRSHGQRMMVNASVVFHSPASGVVFDWVLLDSPIPVVRQLVAFAYAGFGGLIACLLTRKLQDRVEQLGTLVAMLLFCPSIFNLSCEHAVLQVLEKAMLAFLRAYLFYLVSYIAKKHRNFITGIGFVLLFIAFLFDLGCCWDNWRGELDIVHGHDIAMHCVLFTVLCSMVAAMRFFAEDALAFRSYAVMLTASLGATLATADASILWPEWGDLIDPGVALGGVHAILLTVLFYLHQGVEKRDSTDRVGETTAEFSLL